MTRFASKLQFQKKMRVKYGLSLLLILSADVLAAEPAAYRRETRGDIRGALLETASSGGVNASGIQAMRDDARGADIGFAEGRNAISIEVPGGVIPSSENLRKPQGRLSPEERRTLRRQINEVGHDIYTPRR